MVKKLRSYHHPRRSKVTKSMITWSASFLYIISKTGAGHRHTKSLQVSSLGVASNLYCAMSIFSYSVLLPHMDTNSLSHFTFPLAKLQTEKKILKIRQKHRKRIRQGRYAPSKIYTRFGLNNMWQKIESSMHYCEWQNKSERKKYNTRRHFLLHQYFFKAYYNFFFSCALNPSSWAESGGTEHFHRRHITHQ